MSSGFLTVEPKLDKKFQLSFLSQNKEFSMHGTELLIREATGSTELGGLAVEIVSKRT